MRLYDWPVYFSDLFLHDAISSMPLYSGSSACEFRRLHERVSGHLKTDHSGAPHIRPVGWDEWEWVERSEVLSRVVF